MQYGYHILQWVIFLKCPRLYYLHNIYKDKNSRRKISIVNPALSLGIAVHEVLEGLAKNRIKAEDRFKKPLKEILDKVWQKVSGKNGGFLNKDEEIEVKKRAENMLSRVENNPEPLLHKTVKLNDGENGLPPNFLLSEEENIILCGKIDWLIYRPEDDSVHILDFKTGKNEEDGESLQLPIYRLLLENLQKRKVNGASYWYIDRDNKPIEVLLPDKDESYNRVMKVAMKVKQAREEASNTSPDEVFLCLNGDKGCFYCKPFEKILRGEALYIGSGEMNQDLYIV
jgi:ATP-dependent helicase/DNAse subunit B